MSAVEHSLLPAASSELLIDLLGIAVMVSVAFASYRRSRCLRDYSAPKSLAIAVLSGVFWRIWIIASLINRKRLRTEWGRYRHGRASDEPRRESQLTA